MNMIKKTIVSILLLSVISLTTNVNIYAYDTIPLPDARSVTVSDNVLKLQREFNKEIFNNEIVRTQLRILASKDRRNIQFKVINDEYIIMVYDKKGQLLKRIKLFFDIGEFVLDQFPVNFYATVVFKLGSAILDKAYNKHEKNISENKRVLHNMIQKIAMSVIVSDVVKKPDKYGIATKEIINDGKIIIEDKTFVRIINNKDGVVLFK